MTYRHTYFNRQILSSMQQPVFSVIILPFAQVNLQLQTSSPEYLFPCTALQLFYNPVIKTLLNKNFNYTYPLRLPIFRVLFCVILFQINSCLFPFSFLSNTILCLIFRSEECIFTLPLKSVHYSVFTSCNTLFTIRTQPTVQ